VPAGTLIFFSTDALLYANRALPKLKRQRHHEALWVAGGAPQGRDIDRERAVSLCIKDLGRSSAHRAVDLVVRLGADRDRQLGGERLNDTRATRNAMCELAAQV
jgi:hypothetical protein